METEIDIKGLDKAEVLHALYHATQPLGMGFLHNRNDLTVEQVRGAIDGYGGNGRMRFDYFAGRPIKSDIGGDSLDPRLFDRDAGPGAAARAIAELRAFHEQRQARTERSGANTL